MDRTEVELGESPANDVAIGSGESPTLLGLVLQHGFCPVELLGEDPIALNLTRCRPGASLDLKTGRAFFVLSTYPTPCRQQQLFLAWEQDCHFANCPASGIHPRIGSWTTPTLLLLQSRTPSPARNSKLRQNTRPNRETLHPNIVSVSLCLRSLGHTFQFQ